MCEAVPLLPSYPGDPLSPVLQLLTREMTNNQTTPRNPRLGEEMEALAVHSNLNLPTHTVSASFLVRTESSTSGVTIRVPEDGDSPTRKRQRPSEQEDQDSIVVNKMAKPSLSDVCHTAYTKLRNASTKLARMQNRLAENTTCRTKNVIYALFCNKCNKKYIGETKRKFITRWKEHAADTRHNRDTPVAKHMTHCGQNHDIIDACMVSKIHGHPDRTTQQRKTKEKWWIHTLNTHITNGLNLMEWEQIPPPLYFILKGSKRVYITPHGLFFSHAM